VGLGTTPTTHMRTDGRGVAIGMGVRESTSSTMWARGVKYEKAQITVAQILPRCQRKYFFRGTVRHEWGVVFFRRTFMPSSDHRWFVFRRHGRFLE
jgi:hypothetical protein